MRKAVIALILAAMTAARAGEARRRAVRHPSSPPRIASLLPSSGPTAGGTTVVLRGTALAAATLRMGDSEVAPAARSNEEITFVTPPHANGFVPLIVASGGGRAVAEFLYVPPPAPTLSPGSVTTVAGIGRYFGEGRDARKVPIFMEDFAVAADGRVYTAEPSAGVVRRIGTDGVIERFAGIGADFAGDDIGDGGPALEATLVWPMSVAIGPGGAVFIADAFNNRIRRVDPATGIITTVAGSGPNGTCCLGGFGGDGAPATEAKLFSPSQIAFDPNGVLLILDTNNARIRAVTPDGIIRTIAGNGVRGFTGDGGPAVDASIDPGPNGDYGALEVDGVGNIYLGDHWNRRIRRIDAVRGVIETIAGGGTRTDDGAPATESSLPAFFGLALDEAGHVYFTDSSRVRRVDPDGLVRTAIGASQSGWVPDGTPRSSVRLTNPGRMHAGPSGEMMVIDFRQKRLRRITETISTVVGIAPRAFGEDGVATEAELDTDMHQAIVDAAGNLVFGGGSRLRRLGSDATLFTIAGGDLLDPSAQPGQSRPATASSVRATGVAVDGSGNLYVCDREVGRISPDGIYTPLTANGRGFAGDGGPARNALVDNAAGLAIDSKGNLFVADFANNRIRRIDAVSATIETICGNGPDHPPDVFVGDVSSGDGGPAKDAHIRLPAEIAADALDRLYIADTDRIRRIGSDAIIRTVLSSCFGPLASNRRGEVFVYCNGEVRRIDDTERTTLVASVNPGGGLQDGGPATSAGGGFIQGLAVTDEWVYLIQTESRRVRAIRRAPVP